MSRFRFIHVYWFLMALGMVGVLFLPAGGGSRLEGLRAQIQGIYRPVSAPVRWVAARVGALWRADRPVDEGSVGERPRSMGDLIEENRQLRLLAANLSAQLSALKELSADRRQVGRVLPLCEPFAVAGGDPGGRQSLSLSGGTVAGIQRGQAVLYAGGIAGRISRAGAGGSQVQLVTDEGFGATGSFARYVTDDKGQISFVALSAPAALVRGAGGGLMRIGMLSMRQVKAAGLEVGDWVVLNDADWPAILQGYRLGRISAIRELAEQPQFADIQVRPAGDLTGLREVMVMVKER